MIHIYIDAEFDAVRINRKFYQMVISLGAVMVDDQGTVIDEYYSMVKPYSFKRLSNIVKKMTKLSDTMILDARKLPEVEEEFKSWVYAREENLSNIRLYSFGPDDRRTLSQNCQALSLDAEGMFSGIIDLQKEISPLVTYQGATVSPTLSLDDLKSAYGIEGVVDHNALSDARDLMMIHQAVLQGKQPIESNVKEIVDRKIAKQQEVAERQRKRLSKLMKERFGGFKELRIPIRFYPEVIEQFQMWEERDPNFSLHWKKDQVCEQGQCYAYEDLSMVMEVDIESEIPSVRLIIEGPSINMDKKYLLQYRNATMIENICKRLKK